MITSPSSHAMPSSQPPSLSTSALELVRRPTAGRPEDDEGRERQRLASLHFLQILDTDSESEFDDLAILASAVCGTPVCLISFVDNDRLWVKASTGMSLRECQRDVTFCHHTIQQAGLFLIEDASLDARFSANPFVTAENGFRFYAGIPLTSGDGHAVGALCVLDHQPRTLSSEQARGLRILAGQVNARLELRSHRRYLEAALKEAEAAKRRAQLWEGRFQTFMDSGPFLAYIKGADGRMLYYNEPMARLFGVSREAMLNHTDAELWPAHLAEMYRQHDLEVLRSGESRVHNETTHSPKGENSSWRSYKFLCTDAAGALLLGGISVDVSEELRREEELRRSRSALEAANLQLNELASVDALTGLANRRRFDEHIRLAFAHARLHSEPLSLLMLDVDHFKVHNDRFGHTHGDAVLQQLALCLRSEVRRGELVSRYGGEEFVILLPNTSATDATELALRLLARIRREPWPLSPVTLSVGVGTLNPATRDVQHLLGRADEALYAAKCKGRDQVVSYVDELTR